MTKNFGGIFGGFWDVVFKVGRMYQSECERKRGTHVQVFTKAKGKQKHINNNNNKYCKQFNTEEELWGAFLYHDVTT